VVGGYEVTVAGSAGGKLEAACSALSSREGRGMGDTSTRMLRFPQVKERVGYSRMHIDRMEKAGRFPKRVRLGPNSVAWVEAEIEAWLRERMASRDNAG
jgi:prophage regulatory protein